MEDLRGVFFAAAPIQCSPILRRLYRAAGPHPAKQKSSPDRDERTLFLFFRLCPGCRNDIVMQPEHQTILLLQPVHASRLQQFFHFTGVNPQGHRHLLLKGLLHQSHHLGILGRKFLSFPASAFFSLI